ncbi:MAG: Gfo/Idh/MocA family oxidoreductase [Rhodospirillaceae bacterium]
MSEKLLRVLIVGCGRIAGGAGLPSRDGEALTHAAAYDADGRFEISACVDPDPGRRQQFAETWRAGAAYPDLDASCRNSNALPSICAPSQLHGPVLARLLDADVGAVLCEKPLTTDLSEAEQLVAAYEQAKKPLAVGYTRRWHRGVQAVAEELKSGQWGRIRSAHARYARGIRNSGGHIIDLLHMLIGPMSVRYAGNARYDYLADDPTLDAVLATDDGIYVHLMGGDGNDYGLLEVQLMTENGAITLEDWVTRVRRRETTPYRYAPHMQTLDAGTWDEVGAGGSFEAMIDNIYRTVTEEVRPVSDGHSALAAQRIVEELIVRAEQSGSMT